jgi:signal transduction histidine kinase
MPHESPTSIDHNDLLRQLDDLQAGLDHIESQDVAITRLATLGSLACMMAHEMNNLLTPALNYARMAQDAPADSRLNRRAHESTVTSIRACQAMAQSLLGFATSDEQRGGSASVRDAVDRAVQCLPRPLAKDGVRLEVDVDPSLRVATPPTALDQVLLNLVLNARHAMPQGGELRLSAERSTWNTGERCVEIRVADTGVGIPQDRLERIFQPFVSFQKQGDRPGSGLGLAVSRQLIESSGGTIEVESEPGRGSVFTIRLPLAATSAAAA